MCVCVCVWLCCWSGGPTSWWAGYSGAVGLSKLVWLWVVVGGRGGECYCERLRVTREGDGRWRDRGELKGLGHSLGTGGVQLWETVATTGTWEAKSKQGWRDRWEGKLLLEKRNTEGVSMGWRATLVLLLPEAPDQPDQPQTHNRCGLKDGLFDMNVDHPTTCSSASDLSNHSPSPYHKRVAAPVRACGWVCAYASV